MLLQFKKVFLGTDCLVDSVPTCCTQVNLVGPFPIPSQHFFKYKIFWNIINSFTVTFDQFNASLLSKIICFNLFLKILLTPRLMHISIHTMFMLLTSKQLCWAPLYRRVVGRSWRGFSAVPKHLSNISSLSLLT